MLKLDSAPKEIGMLKRTIGTDMILHGRVGMGHGYFSESGVSGEICGVEEHLKVHHIVNDNLYVVGTSFF